MVLTSASSLISDVKKKKKKISLNQRGYKSPSSPQTAPRYDLFVLSLCTSCFLHLECILLISPPGEHRLNSLSSAHTSPPHLQDQAFLGSLTILYFPISLWVSFRRLQLDLVLASLYPLFLDGSRNAILGLLNEWVN